jgi:hypothetical protein
MTKLIPAVVFFGLIAAAAAQTAAVRAAGISGQYLETRTCQVYTGPCFANGEMGLAGKDAVMAWSIDEGQHDGVDLAGLKVVVALSCSTTLGHAGLNDAQDLRSVIYLDRKASESQRQALLDFARTHAGPAGRHVVRIETTPIEMTLNEFELQGRLEAGTHVTLQTRRARPGDCICSNEVAFYPPLAQVETCAAGVTTVGEFRGRGLGTQWSTPDSRSAYMARFAY